MAYDCLGALMWMAVEEGKDEDPEELMWWSVEDRN